MSANPNPLPPNRRCKVWVRRASKKTPIVEVIMLGGWRGLWTHWDQDRIRSYPCQGERCKDHRPELIWYGFAPALMHKAHHAGHQPVVVEITAYAAGILQGLSLRGMVIRLERKPIEGSIVTHPTILPLSADMKQLPPAFDVAATLEAMYHVSPLPLDQEPPPFGDLGLSGPITIHPHPPMDGNGFTADGPSKPFKMPNNILKKLPD